MPLPTAMTLTNMDYKKILMYYDITIPKKTTELKKEAEDVLANKLCMCMKKVSPQNEPKSIGICTKSIFSRKGLKREKFKCKGRRTVNFSKTRKNPLKILISARHARTLKNKKH